MSHHYTVSSSSETERSRFLKQQLMINSSTVNTHNSHNPVFFNLFFETELLQLFVITHGT